MARIPEPRSRAAAGGSGKIVLGMVIGVAVMLLGNTFVWNPSPLFDNWINFLVGRWAAGSDNTIFIENSDLYSLKHKDAEESGTWSLHDYSDKYAIITFEPEGRPDEINIMHIVKLTRDSFYAIINTSQPNTAPLKYERVRGKYEAGNEAPSGSGN